MTKEIKANGKTAEDRFKIFCLYSLAQYTYTIESGERCVETVDGKTLKYIYDNTHQGNPQLILSDLSDMPDEDAVEVAKMAIGTEDFKDYRIKQIGFADKLDLSFGEIHKSIFCIDIERFISIPGAAGWYPSDCIQIDTEDFDVIRGLYRDNGNDYEDDIPENYVAIIDFLRNPNKPSGNAYMLPAFGITDLFEAGIAVRKNKEV